MTMVIAHRGFSAKEPENTLRAFKRALDAGSGGIEFDVRCSKDGMPIVLHDSTVDRTTNGHGNVHHLCIKSIRKFDAGRGEKIPTLEEVLALIGKNAAMFIELKDKGIEEPVLREIYRRNVVENSMVISFDYESLMRVREIDPHIRIGHHFTRMPPPVGKVLAISGNALLPLDRIVTRQLVERLHTDVLEAHTFTVDDPEEAIKMRDWGIDGIITNDPEKMLRFLRR